MNLKVPSLLPRYKIFKSVNQLMGNLFIGSILPKVLLKINQQIFRS